MAKAKFARFVIRKDAGLILGKCFGGLLNPNRVYQIDEVLGELIIRDVGPSAIDTQRGVHGLSWNNTANEIVQGGHHLHTIEEYKILCERGKKI
jgi:hypothetical protein